MARNFNSRKPPRKEKDDGPRFFTSKDGTPMTSRPLPGAPSPTGTRRFTVPDYEAMNNPLTGAQREISKLIDGISNAVEDTAKEAWGNITEGLMFLSERDITRRLLRFQRNPIFGVTDVIADSIDEIIELLSTPKPPPPTPGSAGGLYPPGSPFVKYPTRSMCDAYRALGGTSTNRAVNTHLCWMERRRYVDHRQQWEGRAVALGIHPWYQYLSNEGANSFFSYWTWNRATEEWESRIGVASTPPSNFWKSWPWGGSPPDTSDLTAGQYMITWMTWATYFLNNAIPGSKNWDGLAFSANREIPCQLGDHKDASLDLVGRGGEDAGPSNPYGPEGCLREEPEITCPDDERVPADYKGEICLACQIIDTIEYLPQGTSVTMTVTDRSDPNWPATYSTSHTTNADGYIVRCFLVETVRVRFFPSIPVGSFGASRVYADYDVTYVVN
jgi:hypothetical protein